MGVRSHRVPATRGPRPRCRRSCEPPRVAHDITPVELVVSAVGLDSSRTHAEEEPAMTDLAWLPYQQADAGIRGGAPAGSAVDSHMSACCWSAARTSALRALMSRIAPAYPPDAMTPGIAPGRHCRRRGVRG